MSIVTCPTCTAPRYVCHDDDGTSYFIPARGSHPALADAFDGYHAANLLEALRLVPDTGDWHGSLRIVCRMVIERDGALAPAANQTAEQMAHRAVALAVAMDEEPRS